MWDFNWAIFWSVVAAIVAAEVIKGTFDLALVVIARLWDRI